MSGLITMPKILLLIFTGMLASGQQIDINTGTKGTLNISRGGCGATTASGCLGNLGGIGATTTDTLTNKTLTNPKINAVLESNGSVVVQFQSVVGATEGASWTPSSIGNPVILSTFGSGANVDLQLDPKGTGLVRLPNAAEISIGDGTIGYFLRKAASGLEWAPVSGSGTVTSIGLNGIASFITVSGSPVTTAGSISLALASQSQNSIFAGPTSGSGVPTFRAIVAGDVPSLDASKITSGILAAARISQTVVNNRCLEINNLGLIDVAAAACGTGSGSGITGINSQAGPSITLATGSVGTDFGISSGTNTITFNLPTASSLNRGLLSTADWSTFNGKVSGPGMATVLNNFATWATTGGDTLGTGFTGSTAASLNTVAMRDASGDLYTSWFRGIAVSVNNGFFVGTGGGVPVIKARRDNDAFVGPDVLQVRNWADTTTLSAIDWNGNFTGRSATTLALSANPANCVNAGEKPAGIAADGSAEGCSVPTVSGNGLDIYNVKSSPYNAVGDGSNDDTAEVAAAITACETSSRGGIIYFPPGIYAVSGALTMGNGSGNTESTRMPCMWEGAGGTGAGTSNVRLGASIIRWTGSAPGSTTYMVNFAGPFIGGGIKHLTLDANSKTNLRGVRLMTVSHGYFESVSVVNYAALGMLITAGTTGSANLYGGCDSFFSNLKIVWPATGGSGLALEGNDISDGMDACSNTFYNTMLWNDNATAGTYGLNLGFADNNRFFGLNIYSFPNNVNNSYGIRFTKGSTATSFPHENSFYSVSAHQGVGGTVGDGQPNIFYDYHLGDCWNNCDPYSVGGNVKPIVFSTDRSIKGASAPETLYASTNEDYRTHIIHHSSGGQNGGGNLYFQRSSVDMAKIKAHYFDGLGMWVGDAGGSGTMYERLRLRTNGIITPSDVPFASLGGEPTGSFAYCNNCAVTSGSDNTCVGTGSGALAVKINSVWRCFINQN